MWHLQTGIFCFHYIYNILEQQKFGCHSLTLWTAVHAWCRVSGWHGTDAVTKLCAWLCELLQWLSGLMAVGHEDLSRAHSFCGRDHFWERVIKSIIMRGLIHNHYLERGLIYYHCLERRLIHYHYLERGLIHYQCFERGLLHYHYLERGLPQYHYLERGLIHYHYTERGLIQYCYLESEIIKFPLSWERNY